MSYLKPNTLRLGGSRMERGSRGLAAAAAASLGRASIGSSGRNSACSSGSVSPIPIIAISTGDESSESEIEAEPARIFHRRVSTKRNINSTAAIKEGFLLKQTWSFQRWRRRYFRLKRNKLYYAKDGKACQGSLQHLIIDEDVDNSFIINFTKHLHKKYRFNSFVCFCEDNELHGPSESIGRPLENALVENFDLPLIVWGRQLTAKLSQILGLKNLVFVCISEIHDPVLNAVDYTLQGVHSNPIIIIYKLTENTRIPPSEEDIHELFSWCWNNNFINVALTFHLTTSQLYDDTSYQFANYKKIYYYSPFPTVTVVTSTAYYDFIKDRITNTHGYQFQSPLIQQIPAAFLYPLQSNNRSNPRYVVTGTIGQLYHKFIEQLNGTFKIMPIKNMSRADYYDFYITLASRKVIDIGIQPYPEMLLMANMTEGSYPVGQTSNCIIVPVATKVQKYSYSTKSAIKSPLILDLCRIISLALLDVLSYGSLEFDLRRIGRAVWFAYGTLLLQSVEHRRSRFLAILALAILFSLIMSNIFLAVVTAGFSTILPDRQISTLNDFLQSDLKILMTNFHYNAFFKNGFIPAALEDRFIITKEDIFWKHCESLNTSYAYFVGAELWSMLQLKQKRLPMPRFRKAGEELCTPRVFLKFPIQRDSPFAKSLSVFIKYAQESGLDLKWRELGTQQAIDMQGIKVIEEKVEHPVPLSISHIEEVLYLCFIMWAFALTCFLFELLWHWWTSRENRQIIS